MRIKLVGLIVLYASMMQCENAVTQDVDTCYRELTQAVDQFTTHRDELLTYKSTLESLKKVCDFDKSMSDGEHAIMRAIRDKHLELVKTLKNYFNVDLWFVRHDGKTVFELVRELGDERMRAYILKFDPSGVELLGVFISMIFVFTLIGWINDECFSRDPMSTHMSMQYRRNIRGVY